MRSKLVIALLTFMLLGQSGCAGLSRRDPVDVYVVGVEPLEGQGLELRMLVKLRVQNPNDAPLEYDGAYIAMEVEGQRFASGVTNDAGSIPRFGEALISVPVSISALRILRGAIGALGRERSDKVEYRLTGKLAGPIFDTVRFSSKGELRLPEQVYSSRDEAAGDT